MAMHFSVLIFLVNLDSSNYLCEVMTKSVWILDYLEMIYLLISLACTLSLALEDDQLYCGPRYTHLCLGKGQHVACQFPVPGSGPNCQNYSKIRFTSELRNVITNFINKRRQRIAVGHERVRGGKHIPTPKVMMFVEWDFELARLAQRLADQCYFVHDACRATVRYPYAGQAVGEVRWRYLSDNYDLSAQRAIRRVFDAWWGERRRVEPLQLVQPFRIKDKRLSLSWGHFSQLAVWTLRAVGCGAVRHGEDYPRLLLVCDFSHTNMLGERTIIPGEMAPCPEHTRRKTRSSFPLLCAALKEQIKHSQVVDEEILDESDYDTDDETVISGTVVRQELTKLAADVTGKPKRNRGDEWGIKRLRPTHETGTEEISTVRRWTTGAYIDEHEIISDEESDPITTTTRAIAPRRKMKIKFKTAPNLDTTAKPRPIIKENIKETSEEEYPPPRKDTKVEKKLSGFYDVRMPADINIESSDEDEEDPHDTLILTHTSSPPRETISRTHKMERLNSRIGSTVIGGQALSNIVQNTHLQYNTRHQWKPERDRPTRPGATALLRPEPVPPVVEKQDPALFPRISFNMDDDDAAQLHADTGFKPSWKTNVTGNVP